jgi:hypothetical protein
VRWIFPIAFALLSAFFFYGVTVDNYESRETDKLNAACWSTVFAFATVLSIIAATITA